MYENKNKMLLNKGTFRELKRKLGINKCDGQNKKLITTIEG